MESQQSDFKKALRNLAIILGGGGIGGLILIQMMKGPDVDPCDCIQVLATDPHGLTEEVPGPPLRDCQQAFGTALAAVRKCEAQ